MATLSLISSSPTNAEASQIIGTINALIPLMNAAFGASGSGALSNAITVPLVSNPVNLLSITAGASSGPLILGIGGPSADANQDFIIDPQGTGNLGLGGIGNNIAGAALVVNGGASFVNQVQIAGTTTGGTPSIVAAGSDTNVGLNIFSKGTGNLLIGGANNATNPALIVVAGTTVVNSLQIAGSGSTANVVISAVGSGTNIGITLTAKGTGVLQAGTSSMFAANSNIAVSLTAVGPVGASTLVRKWLTVADETGGARFIPVW